MINLNTYIIEKLHLDKNTKISKSDIEQAYEIAKSILDEGQYKYNINYSDYNIHIDFLENFRASEHEPAKIIGYISRDIRLRGLKFDFKRGKYPKQSGGKEWVEFFPKK